VDQLEPLQARSGCRNASFSRVLEAAAKKANHTKDEMDASQLPLLLLLQVAYRQLLLFVHKVHVWRPTHDRLALPLKDDVVVKQHTHEDNQDTLM